MRTPLPPRALALGLISLLCGSATALAQTAPLRQHPAPYALDSGRHDGRQGPAADVYQAYRAVVEVPDAPWLRLTFRDAALGRSSYLTVTSLADGAQQRLDAVSLAQWQNTSAYFNGDAVAVALHVGPGDAGVFVRMDEVLVGEGGAPESQCGSTDDRIASNNPAAGRLLSIGCTGWIITDGKIVSAGHCTQSGATTLQFNVPPSLSNGALQHPPPQHQYSVDQSSRVYVNGGVGNDWGVFRVFNNTQTGLQPLAAQGASFSLVQNLGPATIRITGYGVDSGTANQTQQTSTGPNAGSSGTTMRYRADTEGGNSGSPVIDEATGRAVGVHTHGGCTTSGSGNNNGTSTFNTAFWNALGVTAAQVSATVTNTGPGTFGAAGGQVTFSTTLQNTGTASYSGERWVDAYLPNGAFYGTLFGPTAVTIPAGGSVTQAFVGTLPARAPAGTYTVTLRVGDYPGTVDDEASFTFVKTAAPRFADAGAPWAFTVEEAGAAAPAALTTGAPTAYALEGSAPNPFSGTTAIRYALPEAQAVRLAVYDLLGREVAVLVDGYREAGSHEAAFDAAALGAGVYVCRLDAGSFSATRRMTLLR